ncbi:MAG: ComF family protein [Halopseudomonas aestusnigri]
MVDILKAGSIILSKAVDYILPPICGSCREPVVNSYGICGKCWADLTFISDPCCVCCGYPFDLSVEAGAFCGECLKAPKSFDRCRAALSYHDKSRDMIIGFKHSDRTYLAHLFTKWVTLAGKEIIADADIITPVPLHPKRLLIRRYNQSGLLAQKAAKKHTKNYVPDLLLRTKNTSSQGHLSQRGRWDNVRAAFQINPKYKEMIRGKKIVLIDDVYTTGATLEACSRTLKKEDVTRIDAIVLARVLKEGGG